MIQNLHRRICSGGCLIGNLACDETCDFYLEDNRGGGDDRDGADCSSDDHEYEIRRCDVRCDF